MSKFKKGLWYQCLKTLSYTGGKPGHIPPHFRKNHWYYCTADGCLKGHYDRVIRIAGFHYKYFSDGEVIKIRAPK